MARKSFGFVFRFSGRVHIFVHKQNFQQNQTLLKTWKLHCFFNCFNRVFNIFSVDNC
ncbi:MAG: hypothetical protein J5975_14145 [Ruminococcus sp.]|nr:hypothetical protein [Ruminococcus sp.]MCC3352505.1 hypothetical protein [Ruminococcus albus 8]